ncbi:hydroxyacylglutathione hydrolase [Caballeronia sp. AZ7_KS35]|uniref:hydroxyacylglutathione hydrolase n=1 Tax=Caballeronia sp. AZ7_KS35 TaxID=2921762 RepID=UPI0020295151|nr:hydroxyacylglutathione hydrolase [Caballeronia sp. AZ7_KS35]
MRDIFPVPAFQDNYIWLICKGTSAVVVDPGDAAPVKEALRRRGLTLTAILATHRHPDHVGGIAELLETWPVPVYGPAVESISVVDHPVTHGDRVDLDAVDMKLAVLDVGGHTLGHIAYSGDGVLFCGDTLFAGGCGRIFEGTAPQMWNSLCRLAALPPATKVYCAHEYTVSNLRFAVAVEPGNDVLKSRIQAANELRAAARPTLPSTISLELETNPFLRVSATEVVAAAERFRGHKLNSDAEVFGALREWKNVF